MTENVRPRSYVWSFLMDHLPDNHDIVLRAASRMSVLNELFTQAENMSPRLARRCDVDVDALRRAIALFMSCDEDKVALRLVPISQVSSLPKSDREIAHLLHGKFMDLRQHVYDTGLDKDTALAYLDVFMQSVGGLMMSYLDVRYGETLSYFDNQVASKILVSYVTVPFLYMQAVLIDDQAVVNRLVRMVRQFALVLPVGVDVYDGTWLFICEDD